MSAWTGTAGLRRVAEAVVVLVGLGLLSAAFRLETQPVGVRVALGALAGVLLWPVRGRLAPEAWLTDGPRTAGRHLLSVCLVVAWFAVLIAVGEAVGYIVLDVLAVPGMAIGFVGSYALADVISNYFTSPQFMMADAAGDDPPGPTVISPAA
jgi:hypothetical protein